MANGDWLRYDNVDLGAAGTLTLGARLASDSGTTGATTTQNWSGWDRSRWRNRNNSTSSTVTTSTGNPQRSQWQSRSSVTTRGERGQRSDGGHRSHERSEERPN